MSGLLSVTFSPEADLELDGIFEQLLITAGEREAVRFGVALDQAVELLRRFPQLGRTVTASLSGLRWLTVNKPFDKWMFFYTASETEVRIVRVLHGAQDSPNLLG